MSTNLPLTHRALVFRSRQEDPKVENIPTPQPTPGSCIVKVICSPVLPYANEVYGGVRPYPLALPIVGGPAAVGRVVAAGPDATRLAPGQLVYVDCFITARDDPNVRILFGLYSGGAGGEQSARLMADAWRDATWAEYVRAPLENVFALDEARLFGASSSSSPSGGLGYTAADLAYLMAPLVAFGGLDAVGVRAGERVIIAPATGWFSGAAVMCALAMGARVVAVGRSAESLRDLKARVERVYGAGRVDTVQATGDVERDVAAFKSFGEVDALLELTPPAAGGSNLAYCGIKALRVGGRAVLMGGNVLSDMVIPSGYILLNDIHLLGKWMYSMDAVRRFIKMVESGAFKLGAQGDIELVGEWPLEDWKSALQAAADNSKIGKFVVMRS